MTEASVFDAEGRAVAFADEGTGPAVVLLPAAGLGIDYLGTLAHVLVEEDFRVLRVGARAFGEHDAATMHDLAQDVVDVMSFVGLDRAWIGGHGFGGAIARTVSLDHPDHVSGVLLLGVDTPETVVSAPLGDDAPIRRDAALAAAQDAARRATPAQEWASLAPMFPVLVVQGEHDEITPVSQGEALQRSAADRVSIVTVDGAGHLFPLTHVGATSWAIEDYLDWD